MVQHELRAFPVRAGVALICIQKHGQAARVVVVIPSQEVVAGYEASAWAYLESGIMVEHVNVSGIHLVHYPHIDEDFELLSRAP